MQKKIACVIPARFNSSRFPGKLLALAGGKTVLQRTLENARRAPSIHPLFVATDDARIAQHVEELGGEVIWTSPTCQNGTERIIEALQKEPRLQQSDCIVNVQGDHPCTEPATIEAIVQALQSDPLAIMATAVTPILHREEYLSPHTVKCVFDQQGNALYFSRSPIPYIPSSAPLTAFAHIGIYVYRTWFLQNSFPSTPLQMAEDLEQLKVLENGHRIKIARVKETILGVDTPQDLKKLEQIL